MPDSERQFRQLRQLLAAAAAGEAGEAEWKQLASILSGSEAARDHAVAILDQMSSLEWGSQEPFPCSEDGIDPAPAKVDRAAASSGKVRMLNLIIGGTLAAALLLGGFVVWNGVIDRAIDEPTVAVAPNSKAAERDDANRDSVAGARMVVAWLLEMSPEATWAADAGPNEFLLRLSAGERLELLSGFARIEFASGAVVILEGPCVFIPTAADRATLVRGRLTGRADNGNFHLTTPAAQVVDLGTEFGVGVDGELTTDVVVFEGSVSVSPRDWQGKSAEPVLLDVGGSARVEPNGKLETDTGFEGAAFYRDLPRIAEGEQGTDAAWLSLVDIVCGGGEHDSLAGSIDPLTGDRDHKPWQVPYGPGYTKSDGKYHRTSVHPMIDGVFIPAQNGAGTVISSAGARFDLPPNDGFSWGPIWARRRVVGHLPAGANDYWGTGTQPHLTKRLETSRSGLLGVHANVGITFDLAACDKPMRGRFHSLQGTLVKLDLASQIHPDHLKRRPVRTIDFWVIVDGALRFHERGIGPSVDGLPFEVSLGPDDRFLTLITTDGGNTISFDNTFLVDPILNLAAPAP